MTDATTHQRVQVSTVGNVGPFIRVPLIQLDEIKKVLDAHHIFYWADENAISFNGRPYVLDVNFGRNGDAAAIQAVLDSSV